MITASHRSLGYGIGQKRGQACAFGEVWMSSVTITTSTVRGKVPQAYSINMTSFAHVGLPDLLDPASPVLRQETCYHKAALAYRGGMP